MLVADHDVVDVGGLVGQMVEARLVAADAEEDVVVDIVVAAVEPVERADDVVLLVGIDLVRAAEAEHLAVPAEHLVEIRRHHDEMADALDVATGRARPGYSALRRRVLSSPVLTAGRLDRDLRQHLHAVDDFDLEPVGVGQPHALAAAGLVDVLDRCDAPGARDSFSRSSRLAA